MNAIGLREAKKHLSKLVARAALGERFIITNRGKPMALLVSVTAESKPDVNDVIRQMEDWQQREGPTLGPGLTVRDLIEEGRRF
jgi:prevent-host-death family protein